MRFRLLLVLLLSAASAACSSSPTAVVAPEQGASLDEASPDGPLGSGTGG